LESTFTNERGEPVRLGDDTVRTGLAIMAKRLDTGSPWVLHNNPRGRYYNRKSGGTAVPNRLFPLTNIVRASAAAPSYFEPERITVAEGVEGAFVDGGVSPHNNPALQLLMLATLEGHALQWSLEADNLLIVSIGTGSSELELEAGDVMDDVAAKLAVRSLLSIMNDCGALVEQLLQWMSRSPTARRIDREVGDLGNDVLGNGVPWLSYLRYDAEITSHWLSRQLGLEFSKKEVESLLKLDNVDSIDVLARIGEAAAKGVEESHFPRAFDPV
jgi:hypothetical protein